MKAKEFDRIFDEGKKDIIEHLDVSSMRRPNRKPQRVNVDFPLWMVTSLDKQAQRLGVTRQSVIKVWIAERLKQESA